MKRNKFWQVWVFSGMIFPTMVCIMSSCENKIEDVNALNYKDTFPVESIQELDMFYSDSAQVKARLISPLCNRYAGENPYIVLPRGLKVYFYDSAMHVRTWLKAGYAIKYDKSEIMEVRNDVVIINRIGEKLNTENLIWDQNRRMIFSYAFVKITRKDEVLFGDGMEADETFEKWVIKKPRGTFYLDADETNTPGENQDDLNE